MRFFKESTKLAIQSHYASLELTIKEQTDKFLKSAVKTTAAFVPESFIIHKQLY